MSILSTIDSFYFLNLKWFSQKSLQCRERQFLCFGNKEKIGMSVGLLVGFDKGHVFLLISFLMKSNHMCVTPSKYI